MEGFYREQCQSGKAVLGFMGDHGGTVIAHDGPGKAPFMKRLHQSMGKGSRLFHPDTTGYDCKPGAVIENGQGMCIVPPAV